MSVSPYPAPRLPGLIIPLYILLLSNKFPHTSFNWSGLDGTQILTHMTPVDTYVLHSHVFLETSLG
jgi:hypothetical protein